MIPTNLDDLTKWINLHFCEDYSKDDVEFISCLIVQSFCEFKSSEDVKKELNNYLNVNLEDDCSSARYDCDFCEKRSECGTNTESKEVMV